MPALVEIHAKNFRSLRDVTLPLSALTVLVGPNNSGKSNVLDLIRFLSDSIRFDLTHALELRGGMERVAFRGGDRPGEVSLGVKAQVTAHSSAHARDEYTLDFQLGTGVQQRLRRNESFRFKRTGGRGRRITIAGSKVQILDEGPGGARQEEIGLRRDALGLSTLPNLADSEGGTEVRKVAELFARFRVFDVDVGAARRPAVVGGNVLAPDASNLAEFMWHLATDRNALWSSFLEDARNVVPGMLDISFEPVGGAARAVAVQLHEQGLRRPTDLADASFGTIRALALLALLYDPDPPQLTCIEEIDHGLHPYAFDVLVPRLREASERTQFIIATHSPVLVNRLDPNELIVCERNSDGSSAIPAVAAQEVAAAVEATEGELGLGELWFSGTLGGVPA